MSISVRIAGRTCIEYTLLPTGKIYQFRSVHASSPTSHLPRDGALRSLFFLAASLPTLSCLRCASGNANLMAPRQRYSRYLPLLPDRRQSSARSGSPRSKENQDSRETRSGRQSSITQASKRRSTMNSRDAAYDEEEQLRLAIAASKEIAGQDTAIESGSRRSKRGRDDSEEYVDCCPVVMIVNG